MPLPDYDEPVELMLDWYLAPEWDRLWLGVADFGRGNWLWQRAKDIGPYYLGEPADVLTEEGNLIFVVLLTGTSACELDYVMIGDNLPPTAELRTDPVEGPGDVYLNARASKDPEGAPLHYEFDTDGDGTFDTDNGDWAYLLVELTEPGVHSVGVRVTDDLGVWSTDYAEVTINNWTAETILDAGDREFNLVQDADGAVHIACTLFNPAVAYFRDLAYATNSGGSWTAETVRAEGNDDNYYMPDVAVDSSGRPWIMVCNYGDYMHPRIEFFVREESGWTERSDLAFESEYNLRILTFRLDSADNPHVVDGSDGWAEGNGWFSYHYYDGSGWVRALRHVPATSADLELTSADQPIILLHHYDLESLLVCQRSGDGWGFSVEVEHADSESLVLDSSDIPMPLYVWYDYSDPYEPEAVGLQYHWFPVFSVPFELRADSWIGSDLVLDDSDEAHIVFQWGSLYEDRGYATEWAVARGHGSFEREWFRKGGGTSCMRIALDEQGDEMAFATHAVEFETEFAMGTYWRLVMYRPGS